MPSTELPLTVRHALGKEAAQDLMTWLEERLSTVAHQPKIRVSAFIARQKVNLLTLRRVSNLFLADQPTLVQKGWQVGLARPSGPHLAETRTCRTCWSIRSGCLLWRSLLQPNIIGPNG